LPVLLDGQAQPAELSLAKAGNVFAPFDMFDHNFARGAESMAG